MVVSSEGWEKRMKKKKKKESEKVKFIYYVCVRFVC